MRRPLWGAAIVYAGGVVIGWWIGALLAVAISLFAVALAAAAPATRFRGWMVLAAVFLGGWANYAVRTAVISPHDLRITAAHQPELVSVRGRIVEPPTQRVFDPDGENESWRTHTVVSVSAIHREGEWQSADGFVAVTARGILDEQFTDGRRVEVFGVLGTPRAPLATGLFDYRAWLRLRGIHFQLETREAADWKLLDAATRPPLTESFSRWAKRTLAQGLPAEDEPLRLSWAMALGWKTALTDEVSEPFMQTGTMHIFAISGLHIAFIAGILVALLRVVRVPRAACGVAVVPLIWFYTAATGWQPSAIRSTIMMTVVIGGWALRRPGDLLNSLGAAALIILVWQPEQLFQASFQLSFFVVLSIALLLPPIQGRVQLWLEPDPLLPPELRPRWKQWMDGPVRWGALSAATSVAAWLGSLPLTAHYFNLVTPVSLPANLVIVPLSSGALACNLGSLLCGDWLPWIGELFNHAGWALMAAMDALSRWFARLPGAFWHAPSPTFFETGVYYALLVAFVSGWALEERRRRWSLVVAVVAIGGLGLARGLSHRAETQITILPLSGGEASWINAPGRTNDLLIDCGSERSAGFVLKPFLRAEGVNFLPMVVLTHGDLRNVGGWHLIEQSFGAPRVATSTARFRSTAYRDILRGVEQDPRRRLQLARGDQFGNWRVLHPEREEKSERADEAAVVLSGEIEGVRVLLLSDLGRDGQRRLVDRERNLRANIIVTGVPEGGEPASEALILAVSPEVIIVTDSESPATHRAPASVRKRLGASATRVLFTSDHGALRLTLRAGNWEIRDAAGEVLASGAR